MSRLIVKNLPKKISSEKLTAVFAEHGTITDVKLSFTKDGKFRRFAFIGYKDAKDAMKAKEYLHNSMISNQKVMVEDCKDFQQNNLSPKQTDKNVKINELDDSGIDQEDEKSTRFVSDSDFLKFKKQARDVSNEFEDETKTGNIQSKFSLRLRGGPAKLTDKQVHEFFHPLKPNSVTILKGNAKRCAFVTFLTQNDLDKALKFNGDCINGKSIKLQSIKRTEIDSQESIGDWKKKLEDSRSKIDIDEIAESGRLFVRNLAFICTEEDLETHFSTFGPLSEIHIPIDSMTRKNIGLGYVTFMFPEHAIKAFNDLDGTAFQGRMLHILPSKTKPEKESDFQKNGAGGSSYKKEKAVKDKSKSQQAYNWNTLFIGTDAVAGAIAEKYNISKSEFLNAEEKGSTAVRVALGETQIVQETRQFLLDSGILLDSFSQPNSERSKTVILAKNLPSGVTASELRNLFEPHGDLGRVLLAPSGVTAVMEFLEPSHARQAFMTQAYRKFHFQPLYLEWAPTNIFSKSYDDFTKDEELTDKTDVDETINPESEENQMGEENLEEGTTIFVKNLNFDTAEENLRNHFCKCGQIYNCTISKKKTHKKEELLSMGYGFVQYYKKSDAEKAIKTLQHSMLDGHKLELKLSKRTTKETVLDSRKKQIEKKQTTAKILVRNVPFQADKKEIVSLFKTFGELKSVRLPKKLSVSGQAGTHRGFAFVDFITKQDAKKAFQALCHSTHLYGRRLVLEWADSEEESVEGLRRKTAERYHGNSKKFKGRGEFEQSLANKRDDS
uniref:probable RNA-binding protein 19 n=1 Tax=Styela clava TaxID=7725 RepID=UPI00193AB16D|nr:probable RNA-binding protein 19 [Styela clava]